MRQSRFTFGELDSAALDCAVSRARSLCSDFTSVAHSVHVISKYWLTCGERQQLIYRPSLRGAQPA